MHVTPVSRRPALYLDVDVDVGIDVGGAEAAEGADQLLQLERTDRNLPVIVSNA